jgi:PAS domain S-box-containing protein
MGANIHAGYNRRVSGNAQLASWLVFKRPEIQSVMESRLGPAAPGPAAVESEVLRRFRSFAAVSLRRGMHTEPALEGIRVQERRVTALLNAWSDAAVEVAGEQPAGVREALAPLISRFRASLRTTSGARRSRGTPRAARRAVTAAIDRVADAYLAIEADTGVIVDANPAIGALLGVDRDALLGVETMHFVPTRLHDSWWTQLDAMTEGAEARRFETELQDRSGTSIPVECSITSFATRNRTLALLLMRPTPQPVHPVDSSYPAAIPN